MLVKDQRVRRDTRRQASPALLSMCCTFNINTNAPKGRERQLPRDKKVTHPFQLFGKMYHPTWKCFETLGASVSLPNAWEGHALSPFAPLGSWVRGAFCYSRASPYTAGWSTGTSMEARHTTHRACPDAELCAALLIRKLKGTGRVLKENKCTSQNLPCSWTSVPSSAGVS